MNYTPDSIKELRKRLHLTQAELAEKLTLSKEMVNKMEAGSKPISELTNRKLNELVEPVAGKLNEQSSIYSRTLIPFFDVEASAGVNPVDILPVTNPNGMIDVGDLLRDSECAIRIYGNSMVPNYPSGCVVGLRVMHDGIVEYGNVYVIETEDNRYLKRLFKDKEKVGYCCVSDNIQMYGDGPRKGEPFYEPFTIPFDKIKRMYRVTGVIKRNENSPILFKN